MPCPLDWVRQLCGTRRLGWVFVEIGCWDLALNVRGYLVGHWPFKLEQSPP
jgi:hypothetical protein